MSKEPSGADWLGLLKAWRLRNRSLDVDEFGFDPVYSEAVEPLFEFLYERYWQVETRGIEHIPAEGRAVLVCNHSGAVPWDAGMVLFAVRREHPAQRALRPLVEDSIYHLPFIGSWFSRLGGVRACQENAQRLLERDELVAVFPEGMKGVGKLFRDRYKLQRFGRGGFVKLCLRTRAPVIPVAIIGAEEIHPVLARVTGPARLLGLPYIPITPTFPWLGPLGLVPLPAKWIIAFGEPMPIGPDHGPAAATNELLVTRLAEEVRQRIQSMIIDLLREREAASAK
jgi:1-acyl-sn-glycerol-3-phosphate acyltransferase